jgi:hypothetical protein
LISGNFYIATLKILGMRKSIIVLIALFICFNYAKAQNESIKEKCKLVITTSLFENIPSPVGMPVAIFNIGTDISLNKNYSIAFNIGYVRGAGGSLMNFSTEDDKGFRLQAEIRRYLNKTKMWEPGVLLFPPHIFQYKTVDKWNAGYYTGWLTDYQYTESKYFTENHYKIYRHAAKLHAIFGYQCVKSYHVVVDFSVGAGLQYIFSESPQNLTMNSDSGPWGQKLHDESGIFPSIGYKMRVGFWL